MSDIHDNNKTELKDSKVNPAQNDSPKSNESSPLKTKVDLKVDEVLAQAETLKKIYRDTGTRNQRVRRDDLIDAGPCKIDYAYYGLNEAKHRTRFVHIEDPGKITKYMKLAYDFVNDPITGRPVYNEVRQGDKVLRSYLMVTDDELYSKGQKLKANKRKESLAEMDEKARDKSLVVEPDNII